MGEQRVSELTPADVERLDVRRAVVERHLGDDESRKRYAEPAGKLELIRTIIDRQPISPGASRELQCLGVVLGDAFVQHAGLRWVIVEDRYGRDAALELPGTSILLYPLRMISKRIEHGREVDVFQLFDDVLEDMVALGALRK